MSIINNILSRDSNSILHMLMWQKFGNSCISIIEERRYHNVNDVVIISIL